LLCDQRKIRAMTPKPPFTLLLLLSLAGCALSPSWHWEKRDAAEGDYDRDVTYCKLQTYSGTDGITTHGSVRRMQACMTAKGWRKVEK
jgi:hypothetical protein